MNWIRFFGWIIIIAIPLGFAELASFITTFDHRASIFEKFSEESLHEFRTKSASNLLGWEEAIGTRTQTNCLGQPWIKTINAKRRRVHGLYADNEIRVVLSGDSYTLGAEVGDSDTYPAKLENLLKIGVANLGTGGYGPVQSLLKLEQDIENYPAAKIIVLNIMYENILRMENSYRPVYNKKTAMIYGFKPYARRGMIHAISPENPWADLDVLKSAANAAFDTDYWAKPVLHFPYTISLVKSFVTKGPSLKLWSKIDRFLGRPRLLRFVNSAEIRANMSAVINRFADLAARNDLAGVVVLIPRNGSNADIKNLMEEMFYGISPSTVKIVSIGDGIDWSRYNLKKERCHPSPYGHQEIATQVANTLRNILNEQN